MNLKMKCSMCHGFKVTLYEGSIGCFRGQQQDWNVCPACLPLLLKGNEFHFLQSSDYVFRLNARLHHIRSPWGIQ